jgi:hypothetical protein
MQQFQWTDHFEEFLEQNRGEILTRQMAEQFKSSKRPKKEWEIVAFQARYCGDIYNLYPDGRFRTKGHEDKPGYSLKEMVADEDVIHSVRRLSDGAVLSPLDKIETPACKSRTIESFEFVEGEFRIICNDGYIPVVPGKDLFRKIRKLPATLLTTVDGKEIADLDNFYPTVVFDDWSMNTDCERSLWDNEYARTESKLFSTREAAEAYVFQNRPVLSLKDVKEACEGLYTNSLEIVMKKASVIVKQKLNL